MIYGAVTIPWQGGQGGSQYASMRPRIAGMALNQLNRSSGPVSFGYSELEQGSVVVGSGVSHLGGTSASDMMSQTTPSVERPPVSLRNELKVSFNKDKLEYMDVSLIFCHRPKWAIIFIRSL